MRGRALAATDLGKIQPAVREAVGPLGAALADPDPWVRSSAANALGDMGRDAAMTAPALRAALTDGNEYVRKAAAWALDRVAPAPGKQ